MKKRFLGEIACATLLFTTLAHAGGDRVVNGSFDTGLSSWVPNTAAGGTAVFDAADGAPSAGSAHLFSPDPAATAALSQCIAFTPTGPIDLFGSSLTLIASGGAFTVMDLTQYDNATCNGMVLAVFNSAVIGSEPGTSGTTWTRWGLQNVMLNANTQSVAIGLFAVSFQPGDSLDILWDHVQFGPSGTVPVELQSFTVD